MLEKIVNNFGVSGRRNRCIVNGKAIDVPNGASVSVFNGRVYINGEEYLEEELEDKEIVQLTINVTGDVKRVEADCDLTINGNVNGNVRSGMGAKVFGNVNGDVRAGMSVDIDGNQTGSISSGMSTTIKNKIYR